MAPNARAPMVVTHEGGLKFAAQVGWSFDQYGKWTYTTDGGKRWASTQLRLPAYVKAYSLPSPQRGYMVGDHGMVYRYRIVPVEYLLRELWRLDHANDVAASK